MLILTEGHKYELDKFENPGPYSEEESIILQFIEKVPINGGPELKTINDGTTNEEVLKVLINRMQYLQNKFSCRENAIVITKLEEALMWLEKRTRDRVNRNVEGKQIK